jgi:signal transduction histidine kinase
MNKHDLEPGLLYTFRLYVAVRMVFVLIVGGFYLAWYRPILSPSMALYAFPFLADLVSLYAYLSWPWLQRTLGRLYLPLALLVSVAGPILQVGYILPSFGADSSFAFLLGFSLLLVPLILTAWQYSFRTVLLFGLGTALFEFVLISSTGNMSVMQLRLSTVALVGRAILTMFVGYIVSNLIEEQRIQRRDLADANRKLVRYAVTLEQLTISRERNRLARELHDTLAHALSGLAVQLDAIATVWDGMPPKAEAMLERALSIARIGLDETRRALGDLRATPLEDLGLGLAIRGLAEDMAARGGLALALDVPEQIVNLSPEVQQCYYRVAQEALENVVRHADARRVSVSLKQAEGRLTLQVSDDGLGFEGHDVEPERFGLRGMRERAELIGGTLTVASHAGKGTTVRLDAEVIASAGHLGGRT